MHVYKDIIHIIQIGSAYSEYLCLYMQTHSRTRTRVHNNNNNNEINSNSINDNSDSNKKLVCSNRR